MIEITTLLTTLGMVLAAALPLAGMTVHKKDEAPYPDMADGAIESLDGTVQIGEGNTTGTVSFTPTAFGSAPRVATSMELTQKSGSSSSTQVERAEVITRTSTSVEVEVELDTAPGAGETTTVRVDVLLMGAS